MRSRCRSDGSARVEVDVEPIGRSDRTAVEDGRNLNRNPDSGQNSCTSHERHAHPLKAQMSLALVTVSVRSEITSVEVLSVAPAAEIVPDPAIDSEGTVSVPVPVSAKEP